MGFITVESSLEVTALFPVLMTICLLFNVFVVSDVKFISMLLNFQKILDNLLSITL